MSAGISEMYRQSGGCSREHSCGECTYIRAEEEGRRTIYRCGLHPFSFEHRWKEGYMACKFYEPKEKEVKIHEKADGQYEFF